VRRQSLPGYRTSIHRPNAQTEHLVFYPVPSAAPRAGYAREAAVHNPVDTP
jgi:hypothetical protein